MTEPPSPTPEQLQAQIEDRREQLAETIDALTAKLDVKAQAQARMDDAKRSLRDRFMTPEGQPQPDVLAAAAALVAVTVVMMWWRYR